MVDLTPQYDLPLSVLLNGVTLTKTEYLYCGLNYNIYSVQWDVISSALAYQEQSYLHSTCDKLKMKVTASGEDIKVLLM